MCSFVYESVHKISPICFHNLFKSLEYVHHYGTRQAGKDDVFLTGKNTNQYGLISVSYYGAKCWNGIPVDVKRTPAVNIFGHKLKAFLIELTIKQITNSHHLPTVVFLKSFSLL